MINLIKRYPLVAFFTLAFLFSWAIYIPLVFVRQGWTTAQIPYSIHYLASSGPALAGVLVTAITAGKAGLSGLWRRITRWQVDWRYAAFAILSPFALFGIAAVLVWAFQGTWPDLRLLGQVNYLPYLGWGVLPLWLVSFGFGEEIGWRGFALPRLQSTLSVSKATLILGLLWCFWHVPAFFYHESYLDMGWIMLPGFVFGVLCGAVLFTWLYNGTGGSVLMVAIWHTLFDLLTASKAGQDIIPILTSAGVIAWALIIVNINKPWGFRFQSKQVITEPERF
ncbi:MAG: CPBP family intramembrane metalloprotease [Anaerolineales bacterium]|nr:CPBP family intramembrane metalloprotease [Anaerolineales bacterium]